MANCYLQSNNWTSGWSAAEPVDGDNGFVPAALGVDVTLGLDRTGVDPDLIRIDEGFDHAIGTSGSPLKIACDKLEHFGGGDLYYACALNAAGALETDDVLIQCANAQALTELDSVAGDLGEFNRVVVKKGRVRILGNTAWDNTNGALYASGLNGPGDINLHIADCDTLPKFVLGSGFCRSYAAITVAKVGGNLIQEEGGAIATLDIMPGGNVVYNHTSMTTCEIHTGGTLDLRQVRKALTFTTVIAHPRSAILGYDSAKHTFSTFRDYRREHE